LPTPTPTDEQLKDYVQGQGIIFEEAIEEAIIVLDLKTEIIQVDYDCADNISYTIIATFF
jgi:hypothetical protein